jgi:hypothetical protein
MSHTIRRGKRFFRHVVREPQPCRGAGRQVLHQHVGVLQQPAQQLGGPFVLQVQRQAFLAAVGPHEVRAQAVDAAVVGAREVAHARAFDLDHPCALVGQLAGAERRGDGVLERERR